MAHARVSGAAGERSALLATKLDIPRPRADRLVRARLIDALAAGMARALTLVCAPAGFGKTTLLADWARGEKRPVAWLALDPDDNDPTRFWRHVVAAAAAALDRAGGSGRLRFRSLLESPGTAAGEGIVIALINKLGTAPVDLALVLDDYHVIDAWPIHHGMAYLLDHLPDRLHLFITSRSDPPLPLPRLRAKGQLVELRAADLRLTREESAVFLRDVWQLRLSTEAVAALETKTEGWAVGLQLAALSLRGRADPDAVVDAIAGTHRYILDYLSEEVLERQPARIREFLLRTSVLERLSGPLCDAVTQGSDGQDILEELERANLFLVPLDHERRWYRYHHLFGDFLRAQLGRRAPDGAPELLRRAARWCESHGLVDDAIQYALNAGDAASAQRLVEAHLGPTLRRGESVTLRRWLLALPADAVRSSPALCVALGLMELHLRHLASVDRLIDHAEHGFVGIPALPRVEVPTDGGMVREIPAALALLRATLAASHGDASATRAHARAALAQMADDERGPRLWAQWLQVHADWMEGRMDTAETGFARLLAEARSLPDPHPLTTSCHALGWVQQSRGQLSNAMRTYHEGLQYAGQGGRFLAFHAGEAHLGIAQVLYARDQLDEALRHVTLGMQLVRQVVEFQLPAFGQVTLGWILQAMGDVAGAAAAMDEACRLLPPSGVATMFSPAQAERAALWLAQGRIEPVLAWVTERGLSEHDTLSYAREREHLVFARLLLAQSEAERALDLLARLDALADSHGRMGSLIEIRALRALALQSAGDHGGALSLLADVLTRARPEGYVRVFADEGRPMAALLQSSIRTRRRGWNTRGSHREREYVARILQAFRPPSGGTVRGAPAVTGLLEPLSDRELEILRLIAAGKRNREIAQELVVTLDTVKKHGSHIFGKLGAANRTEAVARARDLGLIS